MHWNVLADKLAHDSFTKVPQEYLQWSYRLNLILQHVKVVDADMIGLSEVDLQPLYGQIEEGMAKLGYTGYFHQKPAISGSALFYKTDKFDLVEKDAIQYGENQSQFFMFGKFVSKANEYHKFIFGETHLKAKP